jgi:hypothetical protein
MLRSSESGGLFILLGALQDKPTCPMMKPSLVFKGGELSSAAQPNRGDSIRLGRHHCVVHIAVLSRQAENGPSPFCLPDFRLELSPLPRSRATMLLNLALGEQFGLPPERRPGLIAHSRSLLELLTF